MENIETILVHTGRNSKYTNRSVNPILQRSSSIIFNSFNQKEKIESSCDEYELLYGRFGTLTHFSLKKAMIDLEGGIGCMLYPCGMAAISHSILSFISPGDHILVTDSSYKVTKDFCKNVLSKMNVSTTWFHPLIGEEIVNFVQSNTKIVFLESPGSITMEIQDIPLIIQSIKKNNPEVIFILDNTWSAGIFLKGIRLGVDISLQSGTKYLSGHSDTMIGTAIAANERCWKKLRNFSYLMGQTIDADTAYVTARGLRTLHIRLKRHEKSALKIAHWLSKRPEVSIVKHPALKTSCNYKIFNRDFSGSGGLFSFVFIKKLDNFQLSHYLNNFKYFRIAYSWGGYTSLILPIQPEEIDSIRFVIKKEFSGTIIRLYIGLEHVEDLIDDLSNGFSRIKNYLKK